jgi:hypothetical protein
MVRQVSKSVHIVVGRVDQLLKYDGLAGGVEQASELEGAAAWAEEPQGQEGEWDFSGYAQDEEAETGRRDSHHHSYSGDFESAEVFDKAVSGIDDLWGANTPAGR